MTLRPRLIICTAALVMLVSSVARADDPASIAQNQPLAIPSVTPKDCPPEPSARALVLPVFVPNLTPGFEFSAGLLVLKPGADNLGYGTITTFLPIQNPQWAVQTLNPEYQPGFCVGGRYAFPSSGIDVRVNWDHLRTSDSTAVRVSDPTTQWVSPFSQTGPSTSEAANVVGVFHLKAATAQVDFDYDMVNADVSQTLNIGSYTQLRLFAGLSCVRLREQLTSTFYNDPNIVPQLPVIAVPNPLLKSISLNNTSTYTGLGPRLGFASAFNLSNGFGFVGQLSGAILAGRQQPAQYSFAGTYADKVDREQISSDSVTHVVYSGDARVGVDYSYQFGNGSVLSFEAGFMAALFVNPFSTYETSTNVLPLDIGSLSTNSMRHTPSNFTLNGFYATFRLQW